MFRGGLFGSLGRRGTVIAASIALVLIHGLLLSRLAESYVRQMATAAAVIKYIVFGVVIAIFAKNIIRRGRRFAELSPMDYMLVVILGAVTVGEFILIYVKLVEGL